MFIYCMFQKPCDWEAVVSYTDNLLHWQKILLECHWFQCNTSLLAFCTQLHSSFCLQGPKESILSNAPWKASVDLPNSFIKWLAPCTPLETIYTNKHNLYRFVSCLPCIAPCPIPGPVVCSYIPDSLVDCMYPHVFLLIIVLPMESVSIAHFSALKSMSQCPLVPIPRCLPEIHYKFYLLLPIPDNIETHPVLFHGLLSCTFRIDVKRDVWWWYTVLHYFAQRIIEGLIRSEWTIQFTVNSNVGWWL